MANAPDNSSYILINSDSALPNCRQLASTAGIAIGDTGPGGFAVIAPDNFLAALQGLSTLGFVARTATDTAAIRTLTSDSTILITNPAGTGGNPSFGVVANSSSQNVRLSLSSVLQATTGDINFIPGGNIGITVSGSDVTISGGGAALSETFIVQTPSGQLVNEQALSLLSTGIMKSTTSTGVISIATPNTDYQVGNANLTAISGLTPTQGSLITGTAGGSLILRSIGTNNQVPVSNGTDWAWGSVPGSGGAPINADYWVAAANPDLTNEVNLGALTTGALKITVATGFATPSISATLTSIDGLTPSLGSTLVGASSSTYISRGIGSAYNIPVVNSGGTDWAWGSRIFDTGGSNNNLFIGILSGNNTLTGGDNIGVGFTAGQALTTGNNNSLFGAGAGVALTTGEFNTISGASTLALATGSNSNTVAGFNAASAQLIYNNSLYLGVSADAANNNLNNAAAVGNNAIVSRSNQFALGGSLAGAGQQITIGQADPQSGVTRTSSLILGTDNSLLPQIYFKSSSAPASANVAANDLVLSVNNNQLQVTSSTTTNNVCYNPMTTTGDIILSGASGTPGRLGIGSTGQVPTVSGGTLAYATPVTSRLYSALFDVQTGGTGTINYVYDASSALTTLLQNVTTGTLKAFFNADLSIVAVGGDNIDCQMGTDFVAPLAGNAFTVPMGTVPIPGFEVSVSMSSLHNASNTQIIISLTSGGGYVFNSIAYPNVIYLQYFSAAIDS